MTIETDIVAAVVVGGQTIMPHAAEPKLAMPFTVFRLIESDPLMTLQGYAGMTKSFYRFDSWAKSPGDAVTKAQAVATAIDAAFSTLGGFREPPGESAYDPETDAYMYPLTYSFWHP